jgi:class 3 adenylate cyclase
MNTQENVKYIFLDVVGFSHKRTIEAQTQIIGSLNSLVRATIIEFQINKRKAIYLPTGDGICIAFIDIAKPFDLPVSFSLKLLEKVKKWNDEQEDGMYKYEIRIGINENIDNIVIDINGKRNVSGSGINYSQRIMNIADGNQILLGYSSYEKICDREMYFNKFKEFDATVKHGKVLKVYQYVNNEIDFLNSEQPSFFRKPEEIRYRPSLEIGIYSCILREYESNIQQILDANSIDYISLHIALIYIAKRLAEKSISTNFDKQDHYDEFDAYFVNGTININQCVEDIKKYGIIPKIDLETKLVNDLLKKYEYYFISESKYFSLSKDGERYQDDHFSKINISELINK